MKGQRSGSSDVAKQRTPRWFRRRHHRHFGMVNYGIKRGRRLFRSLTDARDWLREFRRRRQHETVRHA